MRQTRKSKQYHLGMKANIGVDGELGLVHSVADTAVNVADVTKPTSCCMARKAPLVLLVIRVLRRALSMLVAR